MANYNPTFSDALNRLAIAYNNMRNNVNSAAAVGSAKLSGKYPTYDPKYISDAAAAGSSKLSGTYHNDKSVADWTNLSTAIAGALNSAKDFVTDVAKTGIDNVQSAIDGIKIGSSGSSGSSGSRSTPVYIDAPYAEQYGMSASTAYQEALANTAHQREVADLKAAGLNPVLSAGAGNGSAVFSGSVASGVSGVSVNSGKTVSALGKLIGAVVYSKNPRLGRAIMSGSSALKDLI